MDRKTVLERRWVDTGGWRRADTSELWKDDARHNVTNGSIGKKREKGSDEVKPKEVGIPQMKENRGLRKLRRRNADEN